jgi:hypothetical protein
MNHLSLSSSKLYTPVIFKTFQSQYERSIIACTKVLNENNEYLVAVRSLGEDLVLGKEYKVIGNSFDQTCTYSYNLFNRIRILCPHALKVLDLMNIKSLPPQYVLKWSTRHARSGTIHDMHGRNIIENPKLDSILLYRYFFHKLLNIAHRATSYPECRALVDNAINLFGQQIEEKITACRSISINDQSTTRDVVSPPNNTFSNAHLKKKVVHTRTSKR